MRDQRRSKRCRATDLRPGCELKIGSIVFPATILDRSESGFAVLVGGLQKPAVKRRVQLHTEKGWFDCRIVRVKEVVPMTEIGDSPATKQALTDGDETAPITITRVVNPALAVQGPWFRVGLRSRGIVRRPV